MRPRVLSQHAPVVRQPARQWRLAVSPAGMRFQHITAAAHPSSHLSDVGRRVAATAHVEPPQLHKRDIQHSARCSCQPRRFRLLQQRATSHRRLRSAKRTNTAQSPWHVARRWHAAVTPHPLARDACDVDERGSRPSKHHTASSARSGAASRHKAQSAGCSRMPPCLAPQG